MSDKNLNHLRELLNTQIAEAGDEAVKAEGKVAPDKIDEIKRLSELIKIKETKQIEGQRRWLPIVLIIALIFISLFLFTKVSKTRIELDLKLSSVEVTPTDEQVIIQKLNLPALEVSGLKTLEIPRSHNKSAKTISGNEDESLAIKLQVLNQVESKGDITLTKLTVPAGAKVFLGKTEVPMEYRLLLTNIQSGINVNIQGGVKIIVPPYLNEEFTFSAPKLIHLTPASDELELVFKVPQSAQQKFMQQFKVDSIKTWQISESIKPIEVSTVLSGVIYLESLDGKQISVRSGENIRFNSLNGVIRTLHLDDNNLNLSFHGDVKGMTTGVIDSTRNLMPSILEWLMTQHGLSLFWGTFSVLFIALRWWRSLYGI